MRYQRRGSLSAAVLIAANVASWSVRADVQLAIGMSPLEAVWSNWCAHREINKTIVANGTHEQWVCYTNDNRVKTKGYLYFDNDVLTAIQDIR